jgi:hypothetical protein
MAVPNLIKLVAGVYTEFTAVLVGGVGNANQIPALNSAGQLDQTMMPAGIGQDTVVVNSTEALAAGALVNLYSSAGALAVRNASAAAGSYKPAHGFVQAAVAAGASATIYRSGQITGLTGLTVGDAFLSTATAGAVQATAPVSGSGYTSQKVGQALSATVLDFQPYPAAQLV